MAANEEVGCVSSIEKSDETVVYDIIHVDLSVSHKAMLEGQLLRTDGHQRRLRLPSASISDEVVIQLWGKMRYLPEQFYSTKDSRVLEEWGPDITRHIVIGCTLIDFCAG